MSNIRISHLTKTVRSSEWWDFKFTSILGTIYATAFLHQIPFNELPSFFFFLLAALTPGASYVSLLNDLTDLEDDRLAGKENRLDGKSRTYTLILLFICISAGLVVCLFLSVHTLFLYLCAWIAFTLYSVSPIRLKKRGGLGVMADAMGSHVFPQLFAIAALTDWYGKDIDPFWIAAVAVWSVCLGLRGILWHQLKDKNNDRISGVETFAQRHEDPFIQKAVRRIIFPGEILAFLFMLGYAQNALSFVFLLLYALLDLLRHFLWNVDIVLVKPTGRYKLLMDEYYGILFPISFLIAGLSLSIFSWVILVLHLASFFRRIYNLWKDIILLMKDALFAVREFLLGY